MAFDDGLAERVRSSVLMLPDIAEKRMFGGLAFMVNGNLCCCVTDDELIVRVGADNYEAALRLPHVRKMDKSGRAMRGWVLVSGEGLAKDDDLEKWLHRGLTFVNTLAAK